jgi:malate/lactate dehydrogenase
MPFIAIIGAGPTGSALAHTLAGRSRIREVRLIDPAGTIAQGKALDILQAGAIENFSAAITASDSLHSAAGAEVVAIADPAGGPGEHTGESGLALVRHLRDAGIHAPFVFAGATQRDVMTRAVSELRVPASLVVGAAPLALESALRAVCGVIADRSPIEISLAVAGVPPKHTVVAWEEAAIGGQPLTSVLGPHEIASVAARIPGLWPPGPYALGAAAARIVEALCIGSRRRFSCFVDVGRGRIAAMPVELQRGGVKRVLEPALTRLERTALENALSDG